jgi:hypothetical protein
MTLLAAPTGIRNGAAANQNAAKALADDLRLAASDARAVPSRRANIRVAVATETVLRHGLRKGSPVCFLAFCCGMWPSHHFL